MLQVRPLQFETLLKWHLISIAETQKETGEQDQELAVAEKQPKEEASQETEGEEKKEESPAAEVEQKTDEKS